MKKLGKPSIGYGASRQITIRERKYTKLPWDTVLFNEAGTGLITFWIPCQTGGLDHLSMTRERANECRDLLEDFWGESAYC